LVNVLILPESPSPKLSAISRQLSAVSSDAARPRAVAGLPTEPLFGPKAFPFSRRRHVGVGYREVLADVPSAAKRVVCISWGRRFVGR